MYFVLLLCVQIELTRSVCKEMQMLRDCNHENINRFIGCCIDPPNVCLVTTYCSRGSLSDILNNKDIHLDEIIISSLIFDIIKV